MCEGVGDTGLLGGGGYRSVTRWGIQVYEGCLSRRTRHPLL